MGILKELYKKKKEEEKALGRIVTDVTAPDIDRISDLNKEIKRLQGELIKITMIPKDFLK